MIQPTYTSIIFVYERIAIWCGFPHSQIEFKENPFLFRHEINKTLRTLEDIQRLNSSISNHKKADLSLPLSCLTKKHHLRHNIYTELQLAKRELLELRGLHIKRYKDVRHANH